MNNTDWKWWKDFREVKRGYLTNDEYRMVSEIYARIKSQNVNYPCKCSPKVIQNYIDEINLTFEKQ